MPAQSPLVEKRTRTTNGNHHIRDRLKHPASCRIQLTPIPSEKPKYKVKAKSPRSPREKEVKELQKLLTILKTPLQYEQEADQEGGDRGVSGSQKSPQWPKPHLGGLLQKQESTEALAIEQLSVRYQNERAFSQHTEAKAFSSILNAVIKYRLENRLWAKNAPPQNVLRVLQCLRLLMRDPVHQKDFLSLGGIRTLAEYLEKATQSYLMYGDTVFVVEILTQLTNIFQKLSAQVEHREMLIRYGVHRSLILLLTANEVIVLHCTLHALISLAQSPDPRRQISELSCIEILLRIIQDYDMMSKKLAANLLRLLCGDEQAREIIKIYDGIPILLSVLQSDAIKLLVYVVWCLVQLAEDKDVSDEIRQRGGISLLLSLLGERKFVSDRTATGGISGQLKSPAILEEDPFVIQMSKRGSSPSSSGTAHNQMEVKDHQLTLKSACCACLAELVLNDTNAQQIVQSNGIYLVGQLIMPNENSSEKDARITSTLQANAFRTLRFLFSIERNRQLFMRVFPPKIFENFIDIGHYNRDITNYNKLVNRINSLDVDTILQIKENFESTNQNREATRQINDFMVLELLGSGGYGSVYKVKKTSGQTYQAMKEINTTSAAWGTSTKERMKSVGDVVNELTIIKEQLRHPNVVRYHKTFIESDRLYIVMELIEGAPISDHFKSLKEKGQRFSEDRIWHIFIQLVLALRYLHKEKKIVHRDLTPNNIMLGEGDKVTITDFGLAKVKQADCSKMLSQVGTIFYSCPEVIQNKPYSEKADIWAIGCILYQMCTLNAPFNTNLLSLALKIVNADYDPIEEGLYSDKVLSTVRRCITADPDQRPDIVGVAAHISDMLLVHLDTVKKTQLQLEKKLDHERKKTKKHFSETSLGMQHYHQLYQISPERYDKLVNLGSSGGGSSMKDESETSDVEGGTKSRAVSSTDGEENAVGATENGSGTDDDVYSSGSECQSREGSAGLVGRGGGLGRQEAPPFHRHRIMEHLAQQLTLEIPSAKYSLDSGNSSGDPSPNNSSPPTASVDGGPERAGDGPRRPRSYPAGQSTLGSPVLDSMGRKCIRTRPSSATTLTISQKKVREITDPIQQMLHQLHKIMYITQLPPTLSHNPRRRVIEQYKRALFAPHSSSSNLKNELRKLLTGSKEVIDLYLGPLDNQAPSSSRNRSRSSERRGAERGSSSSSQSGEGLIYDLDASSDIGITYEQMQNIIELVLVEGGYYNVTPQLPPHTNHVAPPLRSLSMPYGKST